MASRRVSSRGEELPDLVELELQETRGCRGPVPRRGRRPRARARAGRRAGRRRCSRSSQRKSCGSSRWSNARCVVALRENGVADSIRTRGAACAISASSGMGTPSDRPSAPAGAPRRRRAGRRPLNSFHCCRLAMATESRTEFAARGREVVEVELVAQLGPPLGNQRVRHDDADPAARVVDEQLTHHQACLDRLAHAHLVGEQVALHRVSDDAERSTDLVGVHAHASDTIPVAEAVAARSARSSRRTGSRASRNRGVSFAPLRQDLQRVTRWPSPTGPAGGSRRMSTSA